MMHCFCFEFGYLPHWFNESIADVAFVDSEIELYRRREELPFLKRYDRVDHRSYELLTLRRRYGSGYFRRVCAVMRNRLDVCRRTFRGGSSLEDQNELLLSILSDAAGEDLTAVFVDEFGFNPRTRHRQRGY